MLERRKNERGVVKIVSTGMMDGLSPATALSPRILEARSTATTKSGRVASHTSTSVTTGIPYSLCMCSAFSFVWQRK